MGANFYGELVVRFVGDTTSMDKALGRLNTEVAATTAKANRTWSQSAAKAGLAMQNVGRTFTQYYTLPVTAGLGYATYAAYNYQKAMIQVKELTGLTAAEAGNFSDKIREASAEIGNTGGPQAAAEAYYFLASSGLNAQEAFDALTVAMKANVAGMGDIQVTADVISSAINVYRDSGLKAAEAMDILMRTIEVGKAEPAALSASLGRIMPIANQLGVSLDELGGNVAALTLGGLSSAEAVTSLRGSMVALVSPAKMSIEEMKRLGTSYKEITASIRDKGLLPTLKMLWELTDHNMLSMRKIIPNVRATTGVMSLLGDSYENNLEVIARVRDHQGKLNETYRDAAQTDVAAFNRALNSLKSTFIEVGAVVLPFVTKLVRWLGDLIAKFEELSPTTQKWVIGIAMGTAAFFPLLSVVGSLTRGLALLSATRAATTIANVGAAASTASGQVAAMNAAAGGGAAVGGGIRAAFSGMVRLVPAAAIAGLVATAIVSGIDKAAKTDGSAWDKVTAGLEEAFYMGHIFDKGGPLESVGQFIEDFKAGLAEPFVNIFGDPAEGAAAFANSLERAGANLAWLEKETKGYNLTAGFLREDFQAMAELGAEKIAPDFNLDPTFKQVRSWRQNIVKELGVTRKEAQAVIDVWLGRGRGFQVPTQAGKSITEMKARVTDLREQMERAYIFGDLKGGDKIKAQIEDIQKQIRRQRNKSQNLLTELFGIKAKSIPVPPLRFDAKNFRSQLGKVKAWVQAVLGSQELTIKFKRQTIRASIKEMEGELERVKIRIARGGMTTELKAKKDKLEEAIREAKGSLKELKRGNYDPTVALAGAQDTLAQAASLRASLEAIYADPITQAVEVSKVNGNGYIEEDAWGGIIRKPTVALVGEAGPEAIIPLTKPQRALELVQQSGLSKYLPKPAEGTSREGGKQLAMAAGDTHVHYHNHMALPQGIVVSDVERFSRTVQPYVERGTLLAQRRRQRGRPGL